MPVNLTTACERLHARYQELLDQLVGLPVGGSVSEGGRSLSVSASEIKAQMELVQDQAAKLGCPIGTVGDPVVVTSRARA